MITQTSNSFVSRSYNASSGIQQNIMTNKMIKKDVNKADFSQNNLLEAFQQIKRQNLFNENLFTSFLDS